MYSTVIVETDPYCYKKKKKTLQIMLNFSELHNIKNKKLGNFFCQIVVGNRNKLKTYLLMNKKNIFCHYSLGLVHWAGDIMAPQPT